MTLFNLLVMTIIIFSTKNAVYEAPSISMNSADSYSAIYSNASLRCVLDNVSDFEEITFLKGEKEMMVARIRLNKINQCIVKKIIDTLLYDTFCLTGIYGRFRIFVLTMLGVSVSQLLSKWCCRHKVLGQSNYFKLTPFNISLSVHIYAPVDSKIIIGSPIDLNCVIHPAQYLDGNILFNLRVNEHSVKTIGSATQNTNLCTASNKMTICGKGTESMSALLKIYTFKIKEMKLEYYSEWTCLQSVFGLESSVDLKPLIRCRKPCINGIVDIHSCKCVCSKLWDGPSCDKCIITCNHGIPSKECTCHCSPGWTGPTCDSEIPCDISSCVHGHLNKKSCVCICPQYWTGHVCDICTRDCGPGTVDHKICTCTCPELWSGQNCGTCEPNCIHGAADTQNCSCICATNWIGAKCDTCGKQCKNGKLDQENCQCNCFDLWFGDFCDTHNNNPQRQVGGMGSAFIGLIATAAILVVAVPIGIYLYRKYRNKKYTPDKATENFGPAYYPDYPNYYESSDYSY